MAGWRHMREARGEHRLREEEWEAVERMREAGSGLAPQKWRGARAFIDAMLWVAGNRSSWKRLPEGYGPVRATYVRFTRWAQDGTLRKVVDALPEAAHRKMLQELLEDYLDNSLLHHAHCGGRRRMRGMSLRPDGAAPPSMEWHAMRDPPGHDVMRPAANDGIDLSGYGPMAEADPACSEAERALMKSSHWG
ncbi:transposase [Luteimonas salinilitoris]|uniref:Transposase n=1 Tax=Luteimonas salinilitoris TaxID=3237697 RepID=A0ABV4HSX8_9GAMM